jgi:transaldolase/glucose-6-phosphate isomerase
MENPLLQVHKLGQSIWYDNIQRSLITSGDLQALVDQDGVCGVTSNPAIFEKALSSSEDYDQPMRALIEQGVGTAKDIYERLAIQDIQMAADVLAPVYQNTSRLDGYVSFEVSPHLAHDTQGTIEEARRLRSLIDRKNVMIKVPATQAGLPAITQLISEGTNINVTLLFAVEMYEAVAEAYIAGLEQLSARGGELDKVSSVASFFVSRLDSLIDTQLSTALDTAHESAQQAQLENLMGKAAIANAKIAYAVYQDLVASQRWQRLAEQGASPQRLLWASTSTKNPDYPKTMYVDELIGPDTVNTLPDETVNMFRQTGQPTSRLTENWTENIEQARETLRVLSQLGISLQAATDHLLADGVKKFCDPFDTLLSAIEHKRQALLGKGLAQQSYHLGEATAAVEDKLNEWRTAGNVRRLWHGHTSLWSSTDEDQWLGWLTSVEQQRDNLQTLQRIADDIRKSGVTHVVLLGMGGSSLCPEVLRRTFGQQDGFPELHVLDSTVPAQIQATVQKIDLTRTVCIVSSKSGGTIEPNALMQSFMQLLRNALGTQQVGERFIAITDPGTKLYQLAQAEHFRHIVHGMPSIGGRFSALSAFGLLPAAIMGIDIGRFLDSTMRMVQSCAASVPPDANPGVTLGLILGTLAQNGRDKITLVTSPKISSLGTWLEQLIAESTGKNGSGLIPIDGEQLGTPDGYGTDRLFVYIRLNTAPSAEQDAAIDALQQAGQPVVRITLEETIDLGQEFFRWEMATAVAGSLLGLNPFNQPDVEASKVATRALMDAYEERGALPAEAPLLQDGSLTLFADPANTNALESAAKTRSLDTLLAAHLDRLQPGDYFAINAYIEMNAANDRILQEIRNTVRDHKQIATTIGYGPRFLHSTGQLHKGGPDTGVFLQLTADDPEDLPIPGQAYSFGLLKNAQAQGDYAVLAERNRRVVRIHLGADVQAGLAHLQALVQ